MAFFDELGKVISDKSKEAANRVKDITGVLQLKSKLSAEKDKINKAYITLGKAYYDRHEGELEGKFADEFHTIQAGLVKIASLEDEIAELEGTRVCAECGAKVEKNAAFCSRCGAPMDSTTSADVHEPEEPEEMQETIFEEKDEAAADKAVDDAETEGAAGPDADSADASDAVSENTTDTATQNENNSGEQGGNYLHYLDDSDSGTSRRASGCVTGTLKCADLRAIPICIVGNILPILFILLLIRHVLEWMKKVPVFPWYCALAGTQSDEQKRADREI